jgi:arsenite methyltransferase
MTDYLDRPIDDVPPGWAEVYDETSFWSARFGALLFDCLELKPVRDGLDVACGTGFPLIELAQVHGSSSHWIGVDPWVEAILRAQRKIEVLGIENATVKDVDASSMPFAQQSFDLITSNLGINNFASPAAVMRECARVARPGARIALTTNVTGHMAGMYDLLREVLRSRGVGTDKLDEQERHRGTVESITQLVSGAGFEVRREVLREFSFAFVDGSAMLRHSLVKWFLDGWRGAIGSERELWSEVEQRLNERGPLRFTVPALYIEGVKS